MPSKNGFGNSRTPMTKKVGYGSAMHYKNPVKKMDPMHNGEPGVQKEDFKQFSSSPTRMYDKASPNKTKLGRYLMGRKKQTLKDGTEVITDKRGDVVKTKKDGVKTKYKKGSRPSATTTIDIKKGEEAYR